MKHTFFRVRNTTLFNVPKFQWPEVDNCWKLILEDSSSVFFPINLNVSKESLTLKKEFCSLSTVTRIFDSSFSIDEGRWRWLSESGRESLKDGEGESAESRRPSLVALLGWRRAGVCASRRFRESAYSIPDICGEAERTWRTYLRSARGGSDFCRFGTRGPARSGRGGPTSAGGCVHVGGEGARAIGPRRSYVTRMRWISMRPAARI